MSESALMQALKARRPVVWSNPHWRPIAQAIEAVDLQLSDLLAADVRLRNWAPLLQRLFPELASTNGLIESPLVSASGLQRILGGYTAQAGRWWIKCDHALPIAGSVKARGGFYEVLHHAEQLASAHGLLKPGDNITLLAEPQARAFFQEHQVLVGSTGNLGMGIGIMAAALGFETVVHMSREAKPWKKQKLRAHGVRVVEHDGDFGDAVAAGRHEASKQANAYFVDDENSSDLFLGYGVAALRLREQLRHRHIAVDREHPLFVYIPSGVGGASGGITFGLRQVFGDHVYCFLAEPVAAPSVLLRLSLATDRPISVSEIGLDARTEADGLAVARASNFAVPVLRSFVSGGFTVRDEELFQNLYALDETERQRIEPSAAAGLRGPLRLLESAEGQAFLKQHSLEPCLENANHILWTTGGALVPEAEYNLFHQSGARLWRSSHPGDARSDGQEHVTDERRPLTKRDQS